MWNWRSKYLQAVIMAVLVAEAVVIVLISSRIPRPVRAITAGINLVAVAALWVAGRQDAAGR
jgi:hypothetical protein